jgi:hypothetical protein
MITNADGLTQNILPVDNEKCVIRFEQDCTPVLDANKRYSLEHGDGYSASRGMQHVARIPPIVYYKWLYEEGIDCLNPDHKAAVRKKLNSSEYAYLRTGGGHLGARSRTGD